MTITHLDTDTAQEIAWRGSFATEEGTVTHVATQTVSKHRWYTRQLVVFELDGACLGFHYDEPATEMQEGQDRFVEDPVPIFPVQAKQITTTVYEPA